MHTYVFVHICVYTHVYLECSHDALSLTRLPLGMGEGCVICLCDLEYDKWAMG